jgi:hypothetical protein
MSFKQYLHYAVSWEAAPSSAFWAVKLNDISEEHTVSIFGVEE